MILRHSLVSYEGEGWVGGRGRLGGGTWKDAVIWKEVQQRILNTILTLGGRIHPSGNRNVKRVGGGGRGGRGKGVEARRNRRRRKERKLIKKNGNAARTLPPRRIDPDLGFVVVVSFFFFFLGRFVSFLFERFVRSTFLHGRRHRRHRRRRRRSSIKAQKFT